MKWEIVLSTPNKEIYELWHEDNKLLSLDFHPFTNSARIEYEAERRVFLIRKEGFLRNKTVLCNEYGVRMGQLLTENKENVIELNNERFTYSFRNTPTIEMAIYKESTQKPLVVCALNNDHGGFPTEKVKNAKRLPASVESSLLLALCWYMSLPAAKKPHLAYA